MDFVKTLFFIPLFSFGQPSNIGKHILGGYIVTTGTGLIVKKNKIGLGATFGILSGLGKEILDHSKDKPDTGAEHFEHRADFINTTTGVILGIITIDLTRKK